ncbi:ABC transporter permease [Halobaculum sp. MBLA0143]|uniref:ABC transporter permease n=1 Tax=Halobaculum sp. MBLA0143 TaxID=3079933 RepID=UPI00352637FD
MVPDPDPSPDQTDETDCAPATDGGVAGVHEIDWSDADPSPSVPVVRLVLAALAAVGLALAWTETQATNVDPLLDRNPTPVVWLFRIALLTAAVVVLPAAVRAPRVALARLRPLRRDPLTAVAALTLAAATAVAVVGPVVAGLPDAAPLSSDQPPVAVQVAYPTATNDCVASVVGTGESRACPGTLQYPLGTNAIGYDVVTLLVHALRSSLQIVVVTLALAVPIGTLVGAVSGYAGGRVDDVLSWYVDVQQSTPTFVVYLLGVFVFGESHLLFVGAFGLLGWASTAKLVRGAVLERRDADYVRAARGAGASSSAVLRRHILPNVSGTVFVEATRRAPQLLLLEVGLTFVGLGDAARRVPSFGNVIRSGIRGNWWVWVPALVTLTAVVAALLLVGDAFGDDVPGRQRT